MNTKNHWLSKTHLLEPTERLENHKIVGITWQNKPNDIINNGGNIWAQQTQEQRTRNSDEMRRANYHDSDSVVQESVNMITLHLRLSCA